MFQLTDQQSHALTTRKVSVALSAGAGCGKTFVLTQRFLQELQPGTSPDVLQRIVAITFTERAAREMRDRIRTACQSNLRQAATDEEIEHWQRILRGLDSARISTIHAFCASLLRSQAVEAKIDPAFEILEEATGGTFRSRIFINALNKLIAEEDHDSMRLVFLFGLERTREIVRQAVLNLHELLPENFEELTPELLADQWEQYWFEQIVPMKISVILNDPKVIKLLELLRSEVPEHKVMQARRAVLLSDLPLLDTTKELEALVENLLANAKVQGGGTKKHWSTEEVYENVKNGLKFLRDKLNDLQKSLIPEEEDLLKATTVSLQLLRVAMKLRDVYETKKRDLGYLDFDDLLNRTRKLLSESEPVRERVAGGIHFLMVDEFQDTDPTQVEIVRHLCGEELHQGKLFLVGDVKQSIYRFRGADPSVFVNLRKEFPEAGRLPLSENFRSQPAILEFVNDLFLPAMGDQYESLRPRLKEQLSPTPAVEFLFATGDPLQDDPAPQKPSSRELREWEAAWLARRVLSFLEDDTPRIREKNVRTGEYELRRAEAGDIVILFRTLSNIAIYEEALRAHNLEYYLVGGRAFYAQQEIYDLANLCQAIDDVDEEIALTGVLRSPFFSLTDDTIYSLVLHGESLNTALLGELPESLDTDQARQARYAGEVLRELRENKDRLSLVELLNLAFERTGYDAAIVTEFMGKRKLANLKKLIEMGRQFDQSGLFTLKDFVQRLRDSVSEQTDEALAATHPETSNVLRLMTIHQSKGLEFPIVFLADTSWKKQGGSTGVVMHPQLGPLVSLPERYGEKPRHLGLDCHKVHEEIEEEAETQRLLYVATTRAADYLILSAGMTADRKASSPWLKMLADRYDLATGDPARTVENPETIPEVFVHQNPPAIQKTKRAARTPQLPYGEFREAITLAEAASLPDSYREILSEDQPPVRFNQRELIDYEKSLSEISEEQLTTAELNPQQRLRQMTVHCLRHFDFAHLVAHPENWETQVETVGAKIFGENFDPNSSLHQILSIFPESDAGRTLTTAQFVRSPLEFVLRFEELTPPATLSGQLDLLVQSIGGIWQLWLWENHETSPIREAIRQTAITELFPHDDVIIFQVDPLNKFQMTELSMDASRRTEARQEILHMLQDLRTPSLIE